MVQRKFSLQNFEGGRALSREEMKKVLGGVAAAPASGVSTSSGGGSGNCGVKDSSGTWYEIYPVNDSGTKAHAQSLVYDGDGTFTNWCCDSCPWNN